MYYDRKVKYFDYNKEGECLRGAGFAKLEVRGDSCKLQIQISGLPMTDTFAKSVYLVTENKEEMLDSIQLQSGKGSLQKQLAVDNLCNGISYEELMAIRIPISAGYELYCRVKDGVVWEYTQQEVAMSAVVAEAAQSVDVTNVVEAEQYTEKTEPINESIPQTMLATKWEQLSAIYPHIQPFEDDREYLKVGPEDFVVLGRRSYTLTHNSFLLHGYYNYKHLILTRNEWRNEERYYIGVPGNFYEREKQVALMFGFESFECKKEPADMGVYGYYMIRVDI